MMHEVAKIIGWKLNEKTHDIHTPWMFREKGGINCWDI